MGKLAEIAGSNVRRLRRARKLSLEKLGARAGIDVKYLGQIERARANCTLAILEKLAGALGAEPIDLLAPLPESPARQADLGVLMARLDESVSSVREAIAGLIAGSGRARVRR